MRKFTKVCLIIVLILGIVGGGLFVAGVAMGASWHVVRNTAENWAWDRWRSGDWNWNWGSWHSDDEYSDYGYSDDWYDDGEDSWEINDLGEIKSELTKKPVKEYEYSADQVANLDVEVKRAYILLKESSDKDTIRVKVYSGRDKVELDRDDATLSVEREGKHSSDDKHPIQIEIPAGKQFSEADISVGAGLLEMGDMSASELTLGVGGGQMDITGTLKASTMELDCGMGSMKAKLIDCKYVEFNCGMGSMTALFAGSSKEYKAQIDCGIGNVNLGDENYSGISSATTGLSDAPGFIQVECGMGNVDISFNK